MRYEEVHVGKIVATNVRRKSDTLTFLVVAVPMDRRMFDQIVWDIPKEAGCRTGFPHSCLANDAAQKLAGTGRYAAVAVLSVTDGPTDAWARENPGTGPATAVVIDLHVAKPFTNPGEPCTFPGFVNLTELVAGLYAPPADPDTIELERMADDGSPIEV